MNSRKRVHGCHVWKEASHKSRRGGEGGAPAGFLGQKQLLHLKMNVMDTEISLHLFLEHGILNSCSHFSSKMSLFKYFFYLSIFIRQKEST